jgi:hypothetical protein
MFKDKVYEDMDDISRLIEPFESPINKELAQMPDEIEVDTKYIIDSISSWGWCNIDSSSIISDLAYKLDLTNVRYSSMNVASEFFEFKVADLEEGESITYNAPTNTLSHKIFLVKKKLGYEDAELEKQGKSLIISEIKRRLSSNRIVNKPRMNELAEIYGAKDVKADRSYRGKVLKFCKHIESMIDDKKLDIRDMELCQKFADWIVTWVRHGSLPALNNLTRIKIITHENRPIYSIEEKEC